MDLQTPLQAKRAELAATEKLIAAKTAKRAALRPGPGYGDGRQRLTTDIENLTKASARLQREVRTLADQLHSSLQPKLL